MIKCPALEKMSTLSVTNTPWPQISAAVVSQ